MSRILREWRCAAHGEFSNRSGRCPRGCSKRFVVQEFRTAPAIKHGRTTGADRELNQLAASYGMTDIHNGADGESVMQMMRKKPTHAPTWGTVEHAAPGWSQRGESAKTFNPASMGTPAENRIAEVQSMFTQPKPVFKHAPYRPTTMPE